MKAILSVLSVTLLVIFSLTSFSYSQTTYNVNLSNNGTCLPIQFGACIPCQYYAGSEVLYFKITQEDFGFDSYSYEDSLCTEYYSYVGYASDSCINTVQDFNNCQFFVQLETLSTLSLTLTSTEPVVVSLLGDDNPVYTHISSHKVSAQGENLGGVQVHSGGKNFFVERQVSSTQYSTSIGVFTLGSTYTHTPFTFTVSASEIDFPLQLETDLTSVNFSPFLSAQVTNDNTYPTYHLNSAEVIVFVDGTYNLEGLVLTNPFYSVHNLTFFPPFQNNNRGDLVFQLEASSSPFLTVECYQYVSSLTSSYTYNIFDCEMGSGIISSILSGSFLSFSLDEIGKQKIRQPDEMSFSLF